MTPARLPRSILKASRKELDLQLTVTEGQLPTDMTGHAFIVAPVGTVDSGGLPYAGTNEAGTPVFNGDAMIHRLDFDRPGEVHLKSRLGKTPCFYADQASTTDPKFEALKFKNHGLTRMALPLGPRNMVNTAFVPILEPDAPNRLLVTYDAGRPYEVDPSSLELATAVGYIDEWRNFLPADFEGPLPYILSTAHPYYDPHQKEFIAVNYGKSLENLLCSIPFLAAAEADIKELEQILDRIAKFVEGRDYHPDLLEQVRKALGELCGGSPVDGNPSGCLDQIKGLIGLETGPATGLHPELHSHLTSLKKKIDSILPPDFLGFANFVYLIKWNTEGNFNRWQIMDEAGQPVAIHQTMHQIQVTKKYVIVMDTAFKFDFDQLFSNPFPENKGIERLLRKLVTGPQAPVSTMYIIDRADLVNGQQPHNYPDKKNEFKDVPQVRAKKLIVPLEAIHFLANYDGPNEDEIVLYLAHNSADCVAEWLREYDTLAFRDDQPVPNDLVGMVVDPADIGHLGRYIIDGKNGALLSSKVIGQPGAPPGQDPDIPHTWGIGLY
ncbi:MAG: carotenoid oxygenase family protein, partial [Anaerolineae bacterium]|nr:carotenoid oxygenase family protein [Anaerolineae bacterium]